MSSRHRSGSGTTPSTTTRPRTCSARSPSEEHERFTAHLADCAACREEVGARCRSRPTRCRWRRPSCRPAGAQAADHGRGRRGDRRARARPGRGPRRRGRGGRGRASRAAPRGRARPAPANGSAAALGRWAPSVRWRRPRSCSRWSRSRARAEAAARGWCAPRCSRAAPARRCGSAAAGPSCSCNGMPQVPAAAHLSGVGAARRSARSRPMRCSASAARAAATVAVPGAHLGGEGGAGHRRAARRQPHADLACGDRRAPGLAARRALTPPRLQVARAPLRLCSASCVAVRGTNTLPRPPPSTRRTSAGASTRRAAAIAYGHGT